jgi:enterochelin esterase-like enzyme
VQISASGGLTALVAALTHLQQFGMHLPYIPLNFALFSQEYDSFADNFKEWQKH